MRDGVDIMPKETTAIKPLENQLIVERVAFDGGEKFNPNDGWNTLRFALKNVRFNDYRKDGMIFSLVRADQGEILIEFSEFDCSQNCFHGAWPSSAHREETDRAQLRYLWAQTKIRHTGVILMNSANKINVLSLRSGRQCQNSCPICKMEEVIANGVEKRSLNLGNRSSKKWKPNCQSRDM